MIKIIKYFKLFVFDINCILNYLSNNCVVFFQAKIEKDLGNEEYKKRNFEAALSHYNKAIELEPTNMTFYNNVAGIIIYYKFTIF